MSDTLVRSQVAASYPSHTEPGDQCPNCLSQGMRSFFAVEGIPAHSCLLMDTRKQAINYPRRNLKLGFCPACGFVGNTIFDPRVHEYSPRYEETQGFSPTFTSWARQLAQNLIDTCNLRNKTVLEIGCGKGEFLLMLCELGNNRGIGIDPAYVPERSTSPAASRAVFYQELYSQKHAHLQADMICCRHTLEHIASTWQFMNTLRQTVGTNTQTQIFFELPDVLRVLREGAFWDIYYEHCTYFSPGSLARLFRATGFNVTALDLAYADQYILISAIPAGDTLSTTSQSRPNSDNRLTLEDDPNQLQSAVEQFARVCSSKINFWRQRLDHNIARRRRTVLWGSGSKGVSFLCTLGITHQVEYVVDVNPYRHGKFMPGTGHEIVSPQFLTQHRPDEVIVMNPVYVPEISSQLAELGVNAQVSAV